MSMYCTPSDLVLYAIPATAITAQITNAMQVAACVAASGEADASMRARYPLPLAPNYPIGGPFTTYDPALVKHVAYIAAFSLMSQRGFQGGGADNMIRENYYKAVGHPGVPGDRGFFGDVERQSKHLDVVSANPPPSPAYNLPQVFSRPPRGI